MLTFKEYQEKLKEYDDALDEIDLQIHYRKIELLGSITTASAKAPDRATVSCATTTSITGALALSTPDWKTDACNNDSFLADLELTRKKLKQERDYIYTRAEVPTYLYDIPNTETKLKMQG